MHIFQFNLRQVCIFMCCAQFVGVAIKLPFFLLAYKNSCANCVDPRMISAPIYVGRTFWRECILLFTSSYSNVNNNNNDNTSEYTTLKYIIVNVLIFEYGVLSLHN